MTLPEKNTEIWSQAERSAWTLPRELTVSEWADENRFLSELTSSEPGRWRTDRTPYLREIMDAFKDQTVEHITLKASTQVGKTEALLNMLAYTIDEDPSPTMFVLPDKDIAKEFANERIVPMIEISPSLSRHKRGVRHDIKKKVIRLDRMFVTMAGAHSPAGLASRPVRNVFFDEINKYPQFSGKESSPIKLGTERTRTFWNRKIVKGSTPTNKEGFISKEFEKTDKRKFHVPCPHCGVFQVLAFKQVKWPQGEKDAEKIKSWKLAWYECGSCKEKITDVQKQGMLARGVWCPDECKVNNQGVIEGEIPATSHRGYWFNCLYSPWLTFSEIAREFLVSKDNPEDLMNFTNSWLAEDWEEKAEKTQPEKLKKFVMKYPRGVVPDGAFLLTAGVDVQKDHFWYVVRAWGLSWESWLVDAGRLETYADVQLKLYEGIYPAENPHLEPFRVRLACVDSGHFTDDVYGFCRNYNDVMRPTKGMSNSVGIPYRTTSVERYPGTGAPIPGGLLLFSLDTDYFKNKMIRWITPLEGERNLFHLPEGLDEFYFEHMCSEQRVPFKNKKGRVKMRWVPIPGSPQNHLWDCETYAVAAAEMCRVYALREEDRPKPIAPTPVQDRQERQSQGWLSGNSGGWLHGRT